MFKSFKVKPFQVFYKNEKNYITKNLKCIEENKKK